MHVGSPLHCDLTSLTVSECAPRSLTLLCCRFLLELSSFILLWFLWTLAEVLEWRAQDGKVGFPPSSFLVGCLAGCCARPLVTVTVVAGFPVLAPVCVV